MLLLRLVFTATGLSEQILPRWRACGGRGGGRGRQSEVDEGGTLAQAQQ